MVKSVTWNSQFSRHRDARPGRSVGQRRADWSRVSLAAVVRSFAFPENMEMSGN